MRPIISPNVRIRYPDAFDVGDDSVIDDFCYFSTQVSIGRRCHIASNCTIAGGRAYRFRLGDLSSISAGARIWCASNDFTHDLVVLGGSDRPPIDDHPIVGDVTLGNWTGVGANAVIMPDTDVPDGTVIGALSFVPPHSRLEPWSVYAGVPIRRIGARDRSAVLQQAKMLLEWRMSPGRRP